MSRKLDELTGFLLSDPDPRHKANIKKVKSLTDSIEDLESSVADVINFIHRGYPEKWAQVVAILQTMGVPFAEAQCDVIV